MNPEGPGTKMTVLARPAAIYPNPNRTRAGFLFGLSFDREHGIDVLPTRRLAFTGQHGVYIPEGSIVHSHCGDNLFNAPKGTEASNENQSQQPVFGARFEPGNS
jgi:hypothetical protein